MRDRKCTDTGGQLRINKYELWTDRLQAVQPLPFVHDSPSHSLSLADGIAAVNAFRTSLSRY
jgi:hypothetical protein